MKILVLKETNVYYDCSFKSHIIGKAPKGFICEYTEFLNGWYRLPNNIWIYSKESFDDEELIIKEVDNTKDKGKIKKNKKKLKDLGIDLQLFATISNTTYRGADNGDKSGIGRGLIDAAVTWMSSDNEALELDFETTAGMMGMPYQFLPWVDRRVTYNDNVISDTKFLGRKYAEKIAIRSPMLLIQPGRVHYMANASNEERESVVEALIGDQDTLANFDKEAANPHRYYSFQLDYANYNAYVNTLCWACALNLNLLNQPYIGVGMSEHGKFNQPSLFMGRRISENVDGVFNFSQKFTSNFKYTGAIAFYVNSDSQISESVSTSTTQSQLSEKVNGISDLAREIQFILGTNGKIASAAEAAGKMGVGTMSSVLSGIASSFTGSGSLLSTIGESMSTIMAGGKMIFPEIWQDTQFSRSFSINIKLVSPDNDDLSIYHNILVPLMHLLALALPRGTSTNSYISPFLVRAAYKSFMNIDLGIVTGLSISRGAEGCWNRHGIPTVVDVSLDIKDLYPVMNLATYPKLKSLLPFTDETYDILKNDALLAYIANLCGVNVANSDVSRALTFKAFMLRKGASNIPNNIIDATWQKLYSIGNRIFGSLGL